MTTKHIEKIEITPESDNIFADLDIPDPQEHFAKIKLVIQLNKIIEEKGLKQKDTAKLLNIDQPKVSALKCGQVRGFSMERIIDFLNKLDQDVEIIVKQKPTKRKMPANVTVAFV